MYKAPSQCLSSSPLQPSAASAPSRCWLPSLTLTLSESPSVCFPLNPPSSSSSFSIQVELFTSSANLILVTSRAVSPAAAAGAPKPEATEDEENDLCLPSLNLLGYFKTAMPNYSSLAPTLSVCTLHLSCTPSILHDACQAGNPMCFLWVIIYLFLALAFKLTHSC